MDLFLNEDQKKAVKWYDGPVLVIGTPGSGKTTVIVERIRNLILEHKVDPSKILVITFTRAAAQSMLDRFFKRSIDSDFSGRRVRFGTFHSFFFWILKTAYGFQNESILSEDERRNIIEDILRTVGVMHENGDELIDSILRQIEIVDCEMMDIKNYYSYDLPENHFRTVYGKFKEYKKNAGRLDFGDMLLMTYELLTERPDILDRIREIYPYIMVDEFQDTNKLQYEILKMLAAPKNNLFVVGDDDQSIYSFRGARPDIMLSFKEYYDNAEIIPLRTNYRCKRDITRLSSKLISNNKNRYDKELLSASNESGLIKVQQLSNVEAENNLIVKRIKEEIDGGKKAGDIAVLYRTNLSPRRLIYKLKEYNIPFVARDSISNIFSNNMVSTLMDYMYFASGDTRRSRFLRFMNKPVRYVPRNILTEETVDIHKLIKITSAKDYLQSNLMLLRNHLESIGRYNPFAAVNYIRKVVGFDDYIKDYCKERNIDSAEIFDMLDEFQSLTRNFETFPELAGFAEDEKRFIEAENKKNKTLQNDDAVQLMTMHSAKGLEFDTVHIINCVEGEIPHRKSRKEYEMEEERRMFYVAMTRAREKLYIYSPKHMADHSVKISRFIDEIVKGE